MERARIHVHRDSDGSAERFRSYRILLDGVRVGSVKRGRTAALETEAGRHSLQVAIDWGRSLPVALDLGPGDEVDVQCWTNAKPLTALYWITLGRQRYLGLRVSSRRREP
jgi:hypothetical protein